MINWGVWDVKLKPFGSTRRKSPLLQGLGHNYRYLRYDPTQGGAQSFRWPVLSKSPSCDAVHGSDVGLNSSSSLACSILRRIVLVSPSPSPVVFAVIRLASDGLSGNESRRESQKPFLQENFVTLEPITATFLVVAFAGPDRLFCVGHSGHR